MLRENSIVDNVKRIHFVKIKFFDLTNQEIISFETLQALLFKFSSLIHAFSKRRIFVNLDASKKFDFDVMIYHVKIFVNWDKKDYLFKKIIEFILFLNRLLILAETRYWSIELKLMNIVWVLKKIRHLLNSSKYNFIVVFIDYNAIFDLVK